MNTAVFPGWWQVLVAFTIQAVSAGAVVFTYSVVAVPFAEEFQPSRMMLMMGVTVMTAASALFNPWMGVAVDRYPMARMMAIGALCMTLGYLLLSFVTAMWQVLVVYGLLMSVSTTLAGSLTASTLLARWFDQRRGLALGISAMGVSAGSFLFPPLLQWLIDSFEWRMAFRVLSLIILVLTVPLILSLVVDRPSERGLHPDGVAHVAAGGGAERAHQAQHFNNTGAILRNRNFWLIGVTMGCLLAVYVGLVSNFMPFVLDEGISADHGALLMSLLAFCGFIGKLIFGMVADRLDLRMALGLAILLVSIALASFVSVEGFPGLVAGCVLLGLAAGGGLPVWAALIGRVFGPDNYGRAMGLMSVVIAVFNLIAPPFAGLLYDLTGSYQLSFQVFIAVLLLVLPLLPAVRLSPPGVPAVTAQPS